MEFTREYLLSKRKIPLSRISLLDFITIICLFIISNYRQPHVLKSSLGRKSEYCSDPSETVDKNTNQEFPDRMVVI